ncbi:MAG: energy transducer TonB [Candidatus Sulfotelmatobacter sp.]
MGRRLASAVLLAACMLSVSSIPSRAQGVSEANRKVVTRVVPTYPSTARHLNIKGSVKLEAVVAPNGTVKLVEVKGGHPLLAQSAQDAIREWKYEPAPRETRENIEVKFNPE